jgi:hypothetical protein
VVLLGNRCEHLLELSQGGLARVHQRVAAPDRWDLSHPSAIFLPIEHDLVVVEAISGLDGPCAWPPAAVHL